ncbi:MAG: hypothetical protein LH606_07620 [Cytophagaceae bacterium]|nr:hypothetical protein [Cytophagaceae bacterium]
MKINSSFLQTLPVVALLAALLIGRTAQAQQGHHSRHPSFLKERFLTGRWLAGAGLTGAGLAAKAGTFVREGLWAGITANAQLGGVFCQYAHAGLASRYYFARGRDFSFFAEGGYAHGYFKVNRWSQDKEAKLVAENTFFSGNLHYDIGADLWMTRQVSLEGSIRRNHLLRSGDALPGVAVAVNYYF